MKRTVRLSLGMRFIMPALVLIAPLLVSPKLVLHFLPKDEFRSERHETDAGDGWERSKSI